MSLSAGQVAQMKAACVTLPYWELIVDVYGLAESTLNGEPTEEATLLYADVPAYWVRLSGDTRYLAAGEGVALSARMGVEYRTGITDRCEIRNVRTAAGAAVDGPLAYRVQYAKRSWAGDHLDLDLEALD